MSRSTSIPPSFIQVLRQSLNRPRNGNRLIDSGFAVCLQNGLNAYPGTTGADLVDVWGPLPLIPRPGTPTIHQLAAVWEATNRYGGADCQFLEYRIFLLCILMRQFPHLPAGWLGYPDLDHEGTLVREADGDDFDVKHWFPTTQELEELDEAYIAAQLGEETHVENYRARLAHMMALYPRLDERELAHLHRDRLNGRHNLPDPSTLQLLDTCFQVTIADYNPHKVSAYGAFVFDTLERHPGLSLDQLMRLQSASVHRPNISNQPSDEELRVLDEHYLAAQTGDRGHYNGYILLLVETLRKFPYLTASGLKALHSGMAGNGGQQ